MRLSSCKIYRKCQRDSWIPRILCKVAAMEQNQANSSKQILLSCA